MADSIEPLPARLYKYRSLDGDAAEFTRQILVTNRLHFANPTAFNDPFDTLPNVSVEGTRLERQAFYKRMIATNMGDQPRAERRRLRRIFSGYSDAELTRLLREAANDTIKSVGVCSFSARHDDVLMWSHYAGNHTGVCLQFETGPPISLFALARAVRYSAVRPTVNRVRSAEPNEILDAFLTKAEFWEYEQEYRILDPAGGPGLRNFESSRLTGVILGARISAANQAQVVTWLAERGSPVELSRAVTSDEDFRLHVVPLGLTVSV